MKDKPNESQLIAYLYGDLTETERDYVQTYLKNNPEVARELEELGEVRETLGKWQDEEVLEPVIIVPEDRNIMSYFSKTWVSIAATLLLLIVAGFSTGFNIKSDTEGFRMGFGETNNQNLFTQDEVKSLLSQTLAEYEIRLDSKLDGFKGEINTSLAQSMEDNDKKIDQNYQKLLTVSQNQITSYVSQMDRQQKESIENLMAMSQEQQQQYLRTIMTDFTSFLENQRRTDMEDLEIFLTSFKQTTDRKMMETDQILASIISQVGGPIISD